MKNLEFNPHKSKKAFRKNYKLHDLAEKAGKNLLVQWGIEFADFGEDQRYKRLWEKGEDKPDIIVKINNKKFLLDWKSKHKSKWIVNKRAFDAYKKWGEELELIILIVFFVWDDKYNLVERKFAVVGEHPVIVSDTKQWDKNITVEFIDSLPDFTKANLIKFCG